MRIPNIARQGLAAFLWGVCLPALAEPEPLPQPLTLDDALALVEGSSHPQLERARADLASADAAVSAVDADEAVRVGIEGGLYWVSPSDTAGNRQHEDHSATFYVRKQLYDFGRTDARRAAAQAEREGRNQALREVRDARRIEVMARFFDVLMADFTYARENEAMAVAYVTLDRMRDQNELGQISDIELFEMESEYQRIRRQRYAAEAQQRATRARLANALNRPGELPSDLVAPDIEAVDREVPEYEPLLEKALRDNPRLQGLRAEVQAARDQLEAARAGRSPTLHGEVEASTYARELGSSDKARAGIVFDLPIFSGGTVDAAIASAQAELADVQARLRQAQMEVREAVLDLWLELRTLQVQREENWARQDYRDLYLDRSRSLYEMEVKADLGDAMVRLTEAQMARAQTDFDIALGWARLEALTGGVPNKQNEGEENNAEAE